MPVSIGGSLSVIDPRAMKLSILSDIDGIAKHDIQEPGAQGNKQCFAFA